jgi:septum site-determining protein MinD
MTKFIAVVSGKGGVGKTTTTLNLGQALYNSGKKVMLLDGNLVTPNLALQLGLINPKNTLNQFLRREKDLRDVVYLHESGISLIPGSPSYNEFQKTNSQNLTEAFEHLDDTADFVLIDAPSGLGFDVSQILKHSDECLIVVNPTLSSVMDALKTMQLAKSHNNTIAGVIVNKSNRGRHELKLEEISEILNYPILANIKSDSKFRKSLHKQMPLTYIYPRSRSAKQFKNLADHFCLKNY